MKLIVSLEVRSNAVAIPRGTGVLTHAERLQIRNKNSWFLAFQKATQSSWASTPKEIQSLFSIAMTLVWVSSQS